jgi:hypothetical protein
MKPWHFLALAGAIVAGCALHAALPRYAVASHGYGHQMSLVVKLDRWTGKTWRYDTTAKVWVALENPFDQFDPFESGQATPVKVDPYAGLGTAAK